MAALRADLALAHLEVGPHCEDHLVRCETASEAATGTLLFAPLAPVEAHKCSLLVATQLQPLCFAQVVVLAALLVALANDRTDATHVALHALMHVRLRVFATAVTAQKPEHVGCNERACDAGDE